MDIYIYIYIYGYIYIYIWMRIECKLRTNVHYHIIHSKTQSQRVVTIALSAQDPTAAPEQRSAMRKPQS